jgi:membrane dipeptidase
VKEPLFIVDSHLDIAWNEGIGRNFLEPVALSRVRERESELLNLGTRLVSLPDLLASRVRLIFGTIFVLPQRAASRWEGPNFANPDEAHAQGRRQLKFYRQLAANDPRVTLICDRDSLERFVSELEQSDGRLEKLGIIISMEGADPIRQPSELSEWVADGLRLVGPAWKATPYCGGTGEPGPLTEAGYELLAEMARLGVGLDVSHMAEESFYDALEVWRGTVPVFASHSNCRHFVPTDRQLSDDMITQLVARDGVIGVVPYTNFLTTKTTAGRNATLDDFCRHVLRICEIAGHTRAVALGTDWDGGFGAEHIPAPLVGLADLPLIGEALIRHGFSDADLDSFFYGNWLRILRICLKHHKIG